MGGYFLVPLNIPENANPGVYSLFISDFNYNIDIIHEDCFEITQAPSYISNIYPNTFTIGETLDVTIAGVNTSFNDYSSSINTVFISNNEQTIFSNSIDIQSDNQIEVNFTIQIMIII